MNLSWVAELSAAGSNLKSKLMIYEIQESAVGNSVTSPIHYFRSLVSLVGEQFSPMFTV